MRGGGGREKKQKTKQGNAEEELEYVRSKH